MSTDKSQARDQGRSQTPPGINIDQNDRPFRLIFSDSKSKVNNSELQENNNTNKENLNTPAFLESMAKSERRSHVFSSNFTKPNLKILSLHDIMYEDHANPLVTERSQIMTDAYLEVPKPKSILKRQKYSIRNDADFDTDSNVIGQPRNGLVVSENNSVVANQIQNPMKKLPRFSLVIEEDEPEITIREVKSPRKERVSFNIPSIDNLQLQNPSILNGQRDSLRMAESIILNNQYLLNQHCFIKKVIALYCLQLMIILAFSLANYFSEVYRSFLFKFPWIAAITGIIALLIFILVFTLRKLSSMTYVSLLLYLLFSALAGASISVIGSFSNQNIVLVYSLGMASGIAAGLNTYTIAKETPVTFIGGLLTVFFSVLLIFGYSILIMKKVHQSLILWTAFAGIGYGLYLAYDFRQLANCQRKVWNLNAYVAASLSLHIDWILIIWDLSKFVAVTYNNSRASLRRSRTSLNLN
jgi:hypothetical protein